MATSPSSKRGFGRRCRGARWQGLVGRRLYGAGHLLHHLFVFFVFAVSCSLTVSLGGDEIPVPTSLTSPGVVPFLVFVLLCSSFVRCRAPKLIVMRPFKKNEKEILRKENRK